tara:strand:+ start:202 stop:513 length:312 start_codon:yes stop_codon:yes gene_type:complete
MATTTWALAGENSVKYNTSDDFCHTAHWTATRVDGEYTAYTYGSSSLTRPETLTTRADLKAADILADVKLNLGTDRVTEIENNLIAQISEKKTPTQGSFVPAS